MEKIRPQKRRGWIYFGLGCFALGCAVTAIVKDGTAAIALSVAIIFGKYLLGKVGGFFFDDEIKRAKELLRPKDPVKKQIRRHHREGHGGKFKNCRRPECFI